MLYTIQKCENSQIILLPEAIAVQGKTIGKAPATEESRFCCGDYQFAISASSAHPNRDV